MKQHDAPEWISGDKLRAILQPRALADALHAAFSNRSLEAPLRHSHPLPSPTPNTRLLLMPAWEAKGHFGVKLVTVFPGNATTGHATVNATYVLFDGVTGRPMTLMDGEILTLLRTGATSALAARFLARTDARHLLIVGAGRLAPWMARAHAASHPYDSISIWSRNPANAEHVAAALLSDGIIANVAPTLSFACAQADVICCATTARSPVVHAEWVRPGTHIDLVGGFTRDMREVDNAMIAKALLYADSRAAVLSEAGDLTQAIEEGIISPDHLKAELGELCRGEYPGRSNDQQITLFKSVGSAVADLAAATLAWKSIHHEQ
jgi:ornithine cyclodeaminase